MDGLMGEVEPGCVGARHEGGEGVEGVKCTEMREGDGVVSRLN